MCSNMNEKFFTMVYIVTNMWNRLEYGSWWWLSFVKNKSVFAHHKSKFRNTIVFQVTFALAVNWGRNMVSLCGPFFGISWQRKMLKSWSFLSFHNITFNLFTGKSLLKQAKYFAHPNKNLTSWSINNAKTNYHSSCGSHII